MVGVQNLVEELVVQVGVEGLVVEELRVLLFLEVLVDRVAWQLHP